MGLVSDVELSCSNPDVDGLQVNVNLIRENEDSVDVNGMELWWFFNIKNHFPSVHNLYSVTFGGKSFIWPVLDITPESEFSFDLFSFDNNFCSTVADTLGCSELVNNFIIWIFVLSIDDPFEHLVLSVIVVHKLTRSVVC